MQTSLKDSSLSPPLGFKTDRNAKLFLISLALFILISLFLMTGMIDLRFSNPFVALFWMAGFAMMTVNVGYMLIVSIIAFTTKTSYLPEQRPANLPLTAIVYVVRNEHENLLLQKMSGSLRANLDDNAHLWLLSNSDSDEHIANEGVMIHQLRSEFGADKVFYFQTQNNPLRRKHICIHQWLESHPEYRYFVACDADTLLSTDSVAKLVAKAEHPDNHDIAVFQSHISVLEKPTYFTRLLGFGQDICQRLYTSANQKVFGRSVSYGSGCLIRCREFLEIDVPDWVLSHDIWDTVFLEQKGYRVAFCEDVVTWGSFPHNYLEYIKRNRRWINGTLESLPIAFRRGVPLGTRIMVLYPSYMYLSQPLFLAWIMGGFFFNHALFHPMLIVQRYAFIGGSYVDLEMGSHLYFTMFVLAGHRFIKCRSLKEAGLVVTEIFASLLICLNSIVFDSFAVAAWLVSRKKGMTWVPMKKKCDESLQLWDVFKKFWPVTILGIAGLAAGKMYAPLWAMVAAPFLFSFALGIPIAYLTAKQVSRNV